MKALTYQGKEHVDLIPDPGCHYTNGPGTRYSSNANAV